jgi:hypothetical protein
MRGILPQRADSEFTVSANLLEWQKIPRGPPAVEEQQEIQAKLEELRLEHRDLDDAIARVSKSPPFDQVAIQRLKKRKLQLKDQISRLEDQLYPDIIA